MKPFRRHRPSPACLALAFSGALFAATTTWAQSAAASPEDLAKYDSNHNGRLDPDELAARNADEQKARGAVQSSATASGEVVNLSPFEVHAGNDLGYNAASAMSLTRVNAKIEDLGAAVTVVTKQQMEDTASADLNDIFLYEANTQGVGQFTATATDVNGLTIDQIQQSPQTANRVRGIGSTDITVGGFSANARIPVDTYNLDSIEISRGPNSNLAGLGGGSGTVNLNQSQGDLNRTITAATVRGDNWGGYRSTLDVNRPILRDKLAVRVAALYDSKGFRRKPSGDLQRRQYIAATYHPFEGTTIHGSAEFMTDNRQTPNYQTPRDTITFWEQNGKPTWDPITFTATVNGVKTAPITQANDANLPAGLGLDTTQYTRPSMYIDNDQVVLWTPNRLQVSGSNPNVGVTSNERIVGTYTDISKKRTTLYPLYLPPSVSDKSLYDWDKINFSATNWNRDKAASYNVSLDQKIFRTDTQQMYGNAAYRREYWSTYNHNAVTTTSFLYLDINQRLLDGRPNPFFLRPYVTVWEPTINTQSELNDEARAQLAYQLDLSRQSRWLSWIGRQQAVGFYETRFTTDKTFSSREAVLDPHAWVTPTNYANGAATGRVSYKYYLGDNQGYNIDYAPPRAGITTGEYTFHYLSNPATGAFTDEQALFGETPSGASRTRSNLWTRGANLQSFFFGERLVTLFGFRRDDKAVRGSPGILADPTTGLYNWADIDTHGWNAWSYRAGNTRTIDTVIRPFRGIPAIDRHANDRSALGCTLNALKNFELVYNNSDSFNPTTGNLPLKNLLGETLPEPNAKTTEKGFQINMLQSRLWVRILWYNTYNKDARVSGGASTAVGRTQQLDTGTSGFSLYPWARNVVLSRPSSAGKSDAQITADTYALMQLPNGYFDQFSGFNVSDVNDKKSYGEEIEVNFSPTNNWRFKFTAAKTVSTNVNLSGTTQAYIDMRLPAWTTIKDDAGNLWWTTTTASNWYNNNIIPTLKLARALVGLPDSGIPRWSWTGLGNYSFSQGRLKGLGVGGAIRWVDKSAIGFYGSPDPDGIMRSYDPNRAVYDPGRASYDFNASYSVMLFKNRVRMRIQLNGRDIFSHAGLRAIGVEPDGTPANFRILDGPQWLLTTSFNL